MPDFKDYIKARDAKQNPKGEDFANILDSENNFAVAKAPLSSLREAIFGESVIIYGDLTNKQIEPHNALGELAIDMQLFRDAPTRVASGFHSFAIGRNNTADGPYSVAIGGLNTANGNYSVAIGAGNTANGNYSVAIGGNNKASGQSSVAIGEGNTAIGRHSTVIGGFSTNDGGVVDGIDPTDHLFKVGNGTGNSSRSNAYVLLRNGTPIYPTLPTEDPQIVGALWNNAGVVNVSAG